MKSTSCLQVARTGLLVRGWWFPMAHFGYIFGTFLAPVRAPTPGAFWAHLLRVFFSHLCGAVQGRPGAGGLKGGPLSKSIPFQISTNLHKKHRGKVWLQCWVHLGAVFLFVC